MNKLSKQIEIAKRLYGPKPEGSIRNDSYISEVRSRNPSIADVMADALNHRTRAELQGDLAEATEEITRLRIELETAREALNPFAEAAHFYDPEEGDDADVAWSHDFTIGSLRRARRIERQALADAEGSEG